MRTFEIREREDPDGVLRLVFVGEFDLAVAEQVRRRLGELERARAPVRVDLSQLRFMDSTGVQILLAAVSARQAGWPLEVDPNVSPPVASVIDLAGVRTHIWPAQIQHEHSFARPSRGARL